MSHSALKIQAERTGKSGKVVGKLSRKKLNLALRVYTLCSHRASASKTPEKPGEFRYRCTLRPQAKSTPTAERSANSEASEAPAHRYPLPLRARKDRLPDKSAAVRRRLMRSCRHLLKAVLRNRASPRTSRPSRPPTVRCKSRKVLFVLAEHQSEVKRSIEAVPPATTRRASTASSSAAPASTSPPAATARPEALATRETRRSPDTAPPAEPAPRRGRSRLPARWPT